jgi:hypothetical protein
MRNTKNNVENNLGGLFPGPYGPGYENPAPPGLKANNLVKLNFTVLHARVKKIPPLRGLRQKLIL